MHEGVRLLIHCMYPGTFPILAKHDKHWALIISNDLKMSKMSKTLGNATKDDDYNAQDGIKKSLQSKIQHSSITNLEKCFILSCQVLDKECQLKNNYS